MVRQSLVLAACLATLGCESAVPRIDPRAPIFSHKSPEEIAELDVGRAEYIAKCSGCHTLYRPSRGDAAYWDRWVEAMAGHSRLTPEESGRIKGYLLAACRLDRLGFIAPGSR